MRLKSSREIAKTQNPNFSSATAFFSATDALQCNMSDFVIPAELLVVRKNTVGMEKFGRGALGGKSLLEESGAALARMAESFVQRWP
jgi:hypothetical protein